MYIYIMKIFQMSLYFLVISFAACGKSKSKVYELAEASTKAINAYAQAIEENSTDCNKMGNALQKPAQNLAKITIEVKKIGIEKIRTELKNNKKVKLTEEETSARNRIRASAMIMAKCADHPKVKMANKTLLDTAN